MKTKSNPKILIVNIEDEIYFQLQDSDEFYFSQSKVRRVLERFQSYFVNFEKLLIHPEINYVSLQKLIEKVNKALTRFDDAFIELSPEVQRYIEKTSYAINEQRIAGSTIKASDNRWSNELLHFTKVLNKEITRPLKPQQIQASFYLATMKRAANFSVPGAGKTAMMYGAFAYLSSEKITEVQQMLVICPINAFEAWRTEYLEVFGSKRTLNFINLREAKYRDFGKLRSDWGTADIIVINYEALESKLSILNELIDDKVMIVFDEVHRIKGVGGKRATAALNLGQQAKFHYVLTGTPIPNSYKDIYNFLHLLYDREYDSFFGWEVNDLVEPQVEEVNKLIQPFFWRTNKSDLKVPLAEPDHLIFVKPNAMQQSIVDAIYENESNVLSLYLRLLQASTNPELLLDTINYKELGFLNDEVELNQLNALNEKERTLARKRAYEQLQVDKVQSNKFDKGIELIEKLVGEGKKVIVWGMFVKTMQRIKETLEKKGISVNLVYGGTPKEERVDLINDFRDGDTSVMVSNPNTLGESISLHQTVHDAIYFEFNFNLTFMLQSRDRIHRLGLKENQYTRYYYLISEGDRAHGGFIDEAVYKRLKEKEKIMLDAIDGELLVPEVTDNYLEDVKKIIFK